MSEIEVISKDGENVTELPPAKELSKMGKFIKSIESNLSNVGASIKKHLALMIIFILIGAAVGLYAAKFLYEWRMDEVTKVGGFVYDKRVYDVKLRP